MKKENKIERERIKNSDNSNTVEVKEIQTKIVNKKSREEKKIFWNKFWQITLIVLFSIISIGCIYANIKVMNYSMQLRDFKNYVYSEVKDLPIFSINTENSKSITSKEDYITCNVSVSNAEDEYCFHNKTGKIKGRGNSTWEMPKKPYKLKFDSKIDLFGNGKSKTWTLIANYADQSLMRNYLAYAIGNSFDDLQFTTTTQYVDLYVNNKYQGVYLVCEQVEVGKNRVEIEDSIDELDTGYLLELDFRAPDEGDEGEEWFYSNKYPFAIKSPEIEDETTYEEEDFASYIKNFMDKCFEALKSNNYSQVENYLDINTFADAYILNELFNNKDVGFSSFYVYKKKGDSHLYCGPIWDYDLSSGNSKTSADNLSSYLQAKDKNPFFKLLLNYDGFKNLVSSKLSSYKDNIRHIIETETQYVLNNYASSFSRDYLKWDSISRKIRYASRATSKLDTWQDNVYYLEDWLLNSLDYMVSVYCN